MKMSKTVEDVINFHPEIVQGYREDNLLTILVAYFMTIENIKEAAATRLAKAYINLLLKHLEE
jgi:hypothetical protein